MENPTSVDILLHLNNEIAAAIGARRCTLSQLNITPELISANQQKNLRTAAEAQYNLQRVEIPEDSILEQAKAEKEMVYVQHVINSLQMSNENSVKLVAKRRNELEFANEEYRITNNEMILKKNGEETMKFCIKKQDEYVKKAVAIQERMLKRGISDVGQYNLIIDNANICGTYQTKLAQLSSTFKKYHNLPPNIQGAKEALFEAKSSLKVLDQQLQERINSNLNK